MSSLDGVVDTDGVVSVTKERKPFPLTPAGLHKAVCTKATVQEQHSDQYGDSMQLRLQWKLDTQYEDEDSKEDRNYMAFSSFGLSYGPRARLYKAVVQLTGKPPAFKRKEEKRGGKSYYTDEFLYKQFENMMCQVMIEHNPSKDGTKTFANVASYLTTEEEKTYNCRFLPDAPAGEIVLPKGREGVVAKMTEKSEPMSAADTLKMAETLLGTPSPSSDDVLIQKIEACKTAGELDEFVAIVVTPENSIAIHEAVAAKRTLLG